MATKFITRLFSAINDNEDAILNQIENDVDIALEDGELDTEQYSISKIDDNSVKIHDKVNDEDTIATKGEFELEFSEPDSEDYPLDINVSWIDENGDEQFGTLTNIDGDVATVVKSDDKKFTIDREQVRLLDESNKQFAGTFKNGNLVASIGDYDIAFDFKAKIAYNVDDERQYWTFNNSTKFIDLYNKIAKELGAKTYSKKFSIKQKHVKYSMK